MKQKYYRSFIMKRFLTKEEQKDFDEKYQNAKVRQLGSGVADKLKDTDNKFVKVGK